TGPMPGMTTLMKPHQISTSSGIHSQKAARIRKSPGPDPRSWDGSEFREVNTMTRGPLLGWVLTRRSPDTGATGTPQPAGTRGLRLELCWDPQRATSVYARWEPFAAFRAAFRSTVGCASSPGRRGRRTPGGSKAGNRPDERGG